MRFQDITPKDIQCIRQLIRSNPTWGRTKLSSELCHLWDWRSFNGQLNDMACRNLLLKLERKGCLILPKRLRNTGSHNRKKVFQPILIETTPIISDLSAVTPIKITLVSDKNKAQNLLFKSILYQFHYLSYDRPVGENIKYLIFDRYGRPLACLLFGAAAWKTEPRDSFIGWDHETREKNLIFIANNLRFLIPHWVKVRYLASHILGKIARRINNDWIKKYSHPIYLLETFIELQKFSGSSYRAANWINAGQTKGRSRQDRYTQMKVPIKGVYLYPLTKHFRKLLQQPCAN